MPCQINLHALQNQTATDLPVLSQSPQLFTQEAAKRVVLRVRSHLHESMFRHGWPGGDQISTEPMAGKRRPDIVQARDNVWQQLQAAVKAVAEAPEHALATLGNALQSGPHRRIARDQPQRLQLQASFASLSAAMRGREHSGATSSERKDRARKSNAPGAQQVRALFSLIV